MKSTESNLYQEEAQSKLLDRGRAVLDVEVAPFFEKFVEMDSVVRSYRSVDDCQGFLSCPNSTAENLSGSPDDKTD